MSKNLFYWLTTPYQSHIREIKLSPKNRTSDIEKLKENCIWFNDNEKAAAEEFITNLKIWLRENYKKKYPDRADWMDENWMKTKL